MKRVLTGILMTLTIGVALAPAARAAEIPPTAECVALAKKQSKEYREATAKHLSPKQLRKLDRKQINEMAAADCISDPAPLLDPEMKAKPFTEQCVSAAEAAGDYWGPQTKRYNALVRSFIRRNRPLRNRSKKVHTRIKKLQASGASKRRIKPLVRQQKKIQRQRTRLGRAYSKQSLKLIGSKVYENTLVFAELVSLRCVSGDWFFEDEKGPAADQINENGMLVFMTFIYYLMKHENHASGKGEAAGTTTVRGVPLLSKVEVPTEALPTP